MVREDGLSLSCERSNHHYSCKHIIGEKPECLRESENQHRERVISTHLMKTYQRIKNIRQIPDALAEVVEGLMSEWKILHVTNKIGEKKKLQQREYGCYLWN